MKNILSKLAEGKNLTRQETKEAVTLIAEGQATDAQIGAFLSGLRMNGETVEEITGCAEGMRAKATRIAPSRRPLVDTCGTGGDFSYTFNVSTAAAFVAAGAGVGIAKHGNRSVTSKCGSADVLQQLGINIEADVETIVKCIDEVGIGFLFAPAFHPAMQHATGPRQELGFRTVFNILGPLTNPASLDAQVIGVSDAALTETIAQVALNLGVNHVYVVTGADGLDEVTIAGRTKVTEGRDNEVNTFYLNPESLGFTLAKSGDIEGGEPELNARIMEDVLGGSKGPNRDIVLLNAALAIVAGGKAESLEEGTALAASSIDSGAAAEKLRMMRECCSISG